MKRAYFVTFDYWTPVTHGVACASVFRDEPVCCFDDVIAMTNELKERNPGYLDVVVTNWRRFEDPV